MRIVWREGSLLASEEVIMKRYVLKIHYFLSFKHPPPLWEPRSSIFHTRAIWQIFLSLLWSIVFKKQSIEEFQCLIYALWMLYLLCNRDFLTPLVCRVITFDNERLKTKRPNWLLLSWIITNQLFPPTWFGKSFWRSKSITFEKCWNCQTFLLASLRQDADHLEWGVRKVSLPQYQQ